MERNRITSERLRKDWAEILLKVPQAGNSLFLHKELLSGPVRLSAAVRVKDSMPGLFFQLGDDELLEQWKVKNLGGIRFDRVAKINDGYCLPIMLSDEGSLDLFAILAEDLFSTLSSDKFGGSKLKVLFSRLSLWRRFLQVRSGPLSEEEIRGLIGELSILRILIGRLGTDGALEAWQGPRGLLHDFHLSSCRVEVKTWINSSLPRILISDPSQIIVDGLWPVWLAVIEIIHDTRFGRKICDWVELVEKDMNPGLIELFHNLLADAGFLPAHADLYNEQYKVSEPVFYQVVEGFPRIEVAKIPAGCCSVKYAIELSAISSFSKPSPLN